MLLAGLVMVAALRGAPAGAEFYRYLDEDGRPVYVDDIGKIPPRFREEVKRYETIEGSEPAPAPLPGGEGLNPAATLPGELTEHVTPVLIKNNRAYVQATIGYGVLETEVLLVIDTGASVTTLFRPAVERIFMRGLNRTTGRTASGDVLSVELATVDFIEVGPYRKERLKAGIVDVDGQSVDYDGLLGMNFLRGLDFNIDFDRGVIVWK
jgi:hypothetical protein